MQEIINLVNALQKTHGVNDKKRILRESKDNRDFRTFLYYALNPRLTYKVSKKVLRERMEHIDKTCNSQFNNIFEVCDFLSKQKALNSETVLQVCAFIKSINSKEEQEIYIKLLDKSLRLGITAKTVNQIIPNLIPEWEVQQAYPIDSYPISDGKWFSLTQKLNGNRATFYRGSLYARSGIAYEGMEHITSCLSALSNDLVFDGELTLKDKGLLNDNEAFRKATGIINSDNDDKFEISYTIFDCLPTEEFEAGESKKGYKERRELLDSFSKSFKYGDSVSVLPVLYQGTDQSKIAELLDQMVREDKEGLMVNLDVPYKCKRHNGILKVKRFYTADLPIIGCEEGTGRLSGTLGALIVDYKGNKVNVGSGFTDEQRKIYWEKRESLIGMICEVKYKEISSDKKTNTESLQFPVFVSLREDKDDISYG